MKMSLTISKNSKDEVHIVVRDKPSRVKFLDLNLTLTNFAEVLTGLSEVEVEGEVFDLDVIGKPLVRERRSVVLPIGLYLYNKMKVVDYLIEHHQEDGWNMDLYLGSQNSIVYDSATGLHTVNYHVFRYDGVGE